MNNQSEPGAQPVRGRGDMNATIPEVQMEDAPETLQRTPTAPRPVKYQKPTSNEAIERLAAYLAEKGASTEVMEAWQRLLEERQELEAKPLLDR
jgi:hypothetical protein